MLIRQSGQVPAGPRETGGEAGSDGIRVGDRDDRNRARRAFRMDGGVPVRDQHVERQARQLVGEDLEPVEAAIRLPPLEGEVLPFDISEVSQRL